MADKKIIIYSNRYLLVRGLECFINDNFGEKVASFHKEEEFVNYIHNFERAIIIWDNDLFYRQLVEKVTVKDFIIITLGRVPAGMHSFVHDFIPLKAESSYIFNLLKNYIDQLKNPSDSALDNKTELTQREKDIVRLIALGRTNQQIADELSISPHTVITHRKNITTKLGIKTISGLTIYAILNGLVSMDEIERSIK